jgi:hypothetical protein
MIVAQDGTDGFAYANAIMTFGINAALTCFDSRNYLMMPFSSEE